MNFTLVPITTQTDATIEGQKLRHAVGFLFESLVGRDVRIFSARDEAGEPVLTLSVTENEMRHCVGLNNRHPTAEEFAALQPLLDAEGIVNKYDPHTIA